MNYYKMRDAIENLLSMTEDMLMYYGVNSKEVRNMAIELINEDKNKLFNKST